MTEKVETVHASSPAPAPPPKPALPGPLPAEVDHRNTACTPWLPPGVPVINLGHTRPTGAAMPTTELGALRPSLLQLAALGAAPPTLALHYHPHPFLNRSVGSRDCEACWGSVGRGFAYKAFMTRNTLQRLHWASRTLQHLPSQPAEAKTKPR